MKANNCIHALAVTVIALYLAFGFFIGRDYGLTLDSIEQLGLGHKYLYFYHTGYLNFQDDSPPIQGHPVFTNKVTRDTPHHVWPFVNVLSALTCYIFFQKLHLLDVISAHHSIIPILTAFFLYILFLFVRKHWGNIVGLLSVLALITYPRFFGDTFNNIKDVPETILFSVALILFTQWFLYRKLRYLYPAFIIWGLALATKVDAIQVPVILALWQAPSFYKAITCRVWPSKKTLRHILAGAALIAAVVYICYPPLFPWQAGKLGFLYNVAKHIAQIGIARTNSWNLYAPSQILYVSPPVMLVLFVLGLVWTLQEAHRNRLNLLLVIWVLFPVARHCLPYTEHYDGLRHFLVFVVPFAIMVALGVEYLSSRGAKVMKIKSGLVTTLVCLLFLAPNLYLLASLHPYQNTYFNSLIGGLKGAQDKEFPFSCDYYFNSIRKAGEWLNKNGERNAHCFAYSAEKLIFYYISRSDITPLHKETFLQEIPPNTYVVIVPRKHWPGMVYKSMDEILSRVAPLKIVYQIKRQGGEIVTVYYKS